MRKSLSVLLGVFLASGWLLAQGHPTESGKPIKAEIGFAVDTRVGTQVLKAGDYKVICDGKTMTFTRVDDAKNVCQVPCKGRVLPKAADQTATQTKVDASGVTVVQLIRLKGSNIEHTFD